MKSVYLAGSISGLDLNIANEWRREAEQQLRRAGFYVWNPLRGRTGREAPFEIVERDLADILHSDILLVEMNHPDRAYIGTAMEIRYAFQHNKHIIAWGRANRTSFWLQYHVGDFFDTLPEALDYIIERGD